MIPPPGLDTLLLLPEPAQRAEIVSGSTQECILPVFHGAEVRRCTRLDPSGPFLDVAIVLDPSPQELEEFLGAAGRRVRPGGSVVVRLPNPGYWPPLATRLSCVGGRTADRTSVARGFAWTALTRAGFGEARFFHWIQTARFPCVVLPAGRWRMRRCFAWLVRQEPGPKQGLIRLIAALAPARMLASHYLLIATRE